MAHLLTRVRHVFVSEKRSRLDLSHRDAAENLCSPQREHGQRNFGLCRVIGQDMHPELVLAIHPLVHSEAQCNGRFISGL